MVKSCLKGKYNGALGVKQFLCRGCAEETNCWKGGVVDPKPKKSKILREIEALQDQQVSEEPLPAKESSPLRRKELRTPPVDWMSNSLW